MSFPCVRSLPRFRERLFAPPAAGWNKQLVLGAAVDHALGLAFRAGQGIVLHQLDLGGDEDFVLEGAGDGFLKAAQDAHVFHEALFADFHLHLHGVLEAVAFENDEVVLPHFGVGHEHALHLHGIDVDALDDDHVVRAAEDAVDAAVLAPAGAVAGDDAGEIARAVAQDGHPVAAEGGQHQFAHFAVRDEPAGFGIDDFKKVGVLPQVQAVLFLTLEGHARAVHFGEPVGVVDLHAEQALDAPPRLLGVGFRAHAGDAQGHGARIFPFFDERGAQMQGVGGQDMRHGGAEVLDQLELALGVARPGGDGHAAETLRPEVDAEAAREQAVAGHVLEDVALAHARHVQAAGHEVGPAVDVRLGVADGHGGAGGAA